MFDICFKLLIILVLSSHTVLEKKRQENMYVFAPNKFVQSPNAKKCTFVYCDIYIYHLIGSIAFSLLCKFVGKCKVSVGQKIFLKKKEKRKYL